MFEEEAEEKGVKYANKQYPTPSIHEDNGYSWGQVEEGYENGFKDGAEFGYNKANEWHYVKDGKYPKEKQLVMVYRVNPLGANIAITNWYDSYKDTKVIAWKEIVLPELPKESE